MNKLLSILAIWLALALPAHAANVKISDLPAASSVTGTNLFECSQSATSRKCTAAQIAAYTYSLMSGDATASSGGAVTFATVNSNVGSFGSATACTAITVNAKGLVTAASASTCAPNISNVAGLGTGVGTFLATPSSANLLAALTTKTGTGSAVFGTAPTLTALTLSDLGGGGTLCLHVNNSGVLSTASGDCGTGGSGSVTSVAAGCGTSTGGSPITTTGTVLAAITSRVNTATSGAGADFVSTDCGNTVYDNSASTIAIVLPQAGTTGFATGTFFERCNINTGVATITPATSTIGGQSSLAVPGGTALAPVCYTFQSDGSNYKIIDSPTINAALLTAGTLAAGRMPALTGDVTSNAGAVATTLAAGSASNLNSGTLAAARGGAGTINGALKGNGSGVVSQAACADLSNGATGCSTATGTSGGTLPLLNGTNTWSGTQTFGSVVGTVTTQSGTTYTLAAADCGTLVRFSNGSAVTVTIPQGLAVGCNIAIEQAGAGQVSVNGSAVTPATLHNAHSYTKTFGQYAIIGISTDASNVAILTGDGA